MNLSNPNYFGIGYDSRNGGWVEVREGKEVGLVVSMAVFHEHMEVVSPCLF